MYLSCFFFFQKEVSADIFAEMFETFMLDLDHISQYFKITNAHYFQKVRS